VENIGDDGIVHNGGATIHHNIVRNTLEISGHPDGIVGLGHNVYIYNNIVYDWNTQPLYPGISREVHTNFFVYGNVIYSEDLVESQETCALFTVEASFPYSAGTGTINGTWGNVIVANNSFIAGRYVSNPFNIPNRYSPTNRPGEIGLTIALEDWVIKNNIFHSGDSFALDLKGSYQQGWDYDEANMVVENNIMFSDTANGLRIRYGADTYYDDVAAFEAGTTQTGNSQGEPTFENFEGRDFRLAGSDTVAIGAGQNLSGLGLPGIEFDVAGTYRGAGAWDIGAFAYSAGDASLLLYLNFEDDFVSNGFAADNSGNDAHMLRYGWSGGDTTNFPTSATGKIGSGAASFLPYYDSHPYTDPDFNDGQYGSVTNLNLLVSLTNATIMLWVKFANTGTSSDTDNHNGTMLNAGYSTQGSWHFGRYYSTTYGEPQFNIQTNVAGGADATWRNKWPQPVADYYYTNNTWTHYAATVAITGDGTNVVVKLYTNGSPIATNNLALAPGNAVPALTAHDPTGASYGPWIAVGCWTHNGNPPLETTGTPNNGWLNADLDEIRIYNRVLTDSEINLEWSTGSSGGGEGNGNSRGRGLGKVKRNATRR